MTTSKPRWFALLEQAVNESSIAEVANRLHYSRTAISLALAGKYPGKTGRIEAAVLARLDLQVSCPYLGETVGLDLCRSHISGPAPMHNPIKMAQWRACQRCPHRPGGQHEERK